MWCRPPRHRSTPPLLPFMEEEGLHTTAPVLPSDGDHKPDWSRIMHLAPAKNPNVRGVVLEGETVLLDLVTGQSFRLNAVGTAVWEHCTGTATLEQIHHTISARLEGHVGDLREQMIACVVQWSHDGLLHEPDGTGR
jgi:hypothetical protein